MSDSPNGDTATEDEPDAWAEWLIEHEYHDISLKTEG